jgi:hypothetical protein
MLSHLDTLIPCQGSAKLLRQCCDRSSYGFTDRESAMPGPSAILFSGGGGREVIQTRQVQQHGEACGALHECADRRRSRADDEVTLPVARDGSVIDFGRSLADQDLGWDLPLAPNARTLPGLAQSPARA